MSPNRYSEPDEDEPAGFPPDPAEPVAHPVAHPEGCRKGWLGDPDADNPEPCLVCRPHLSLERRIRNLGQ